MVFFIKINLEDLYALKIFFIVSERLENITNAINKILKNMFSLIKISFGEKVLSPARKIIETIIEARIMVVKLEFILSFFLFEEGK